MIKIPGLCAKTTFAFLLVGWLLGLGIFVLIRFSGTGLRPVSGYLQAYGVASFFKCGLNTGPVTVAVDGKWITYVNPKTSARP